MQLYIVTGASRGIGNALARQAAALPDTAVLALSRSGLTGPLLGVKDVRCDLMEREGRRAAVRAIERQLNERAWKRAVLVNNAATVEPVALAEDVDVEALERSFALNVVAPVALTQAFLKSSASVPLRAVINMSSGAGRHPVNGWTAYSSAKAAIDMVTQVAQSESEMRQAKTPGSAVKFTSLAPGLVDAAMQGVIRTLDDTRFPDVQKFHEWKATGVLQDPEAVAAKILRLDGEGRLPAGLATLAEL